MFNIFIDSDILSEVSTKLMTLGIIHSRAMQQYFLPDSNFVPAKIPHDVERDDEDDDGDGGVDAVHETEVVVPAGDGAVQRTGEGGQSLDDRLRDGEEAQDLAGLVGLGEAEDGRATAHHAGDAAKRLTCQWLTSPGAQGSP